MSLQSIITNESSDQRKYGIDSEQLFTFVKDDDLREQRIISTCRLNLENIKTVTTDDIFKVNSYWKDRDLL